VPPAKRIRILPEETVNRVAAGEVVERPAAALKELIENGLDAGAASIAVELERAGKSLIRVTDDGAGMGHDELLLALERHATSKIVAVEDLARVSTFGFRGEALPSIAAVSRLVIETREHGAPAGTRLEADGGRIVRVGPCGCPEGTRVEVRDLFHTVPARLKFLRTDATELARCLEVASRLALACPAVGFAVRHGDRDLLRLAPATDAGTRLRDYLGREFFAGLVPVRGARGELSVSGFVSRPGAGRPGPEHQQIFVNGRPVRDPLLAQGVREACRDHFLQEAGGVAYYLWVVLPPDAVDVNVHPTKREVRFRDLPAVRGVVGEALRSALRTDRAAGIPVTARVGVALPPLDRAGGLSPFAADAGAAYDRSSSQGRLPLPLPPDRAPTGETTVLPLGLPQPTPSTPSTTGQLFGTYLLCPGPDGLVIVDQHAAHERVLYERFLARPPGAASQQLFEPLLLELSPAEESVFESLGPALAAVGIAVAPFGPRSWRVTALPPELPPAEAATFVRELAAAILAEASPRRVGEHRHRAAAILACHAAVRANRRLGPAETASLLAELARCDNPGACPHGRPTTITIDRAEIERRFKRG
jgi:DNA mismatch repair protein MutL